MVGKDPQHLLTGSRGDQLLFVQPAQETADLPDRMIIVLFGVDLIPFKEHAAYFRFGQAELFHGIVHLLHPDDRQQDVKSGIIADHHHQIDQILDRQFHAFMQEPQTPTVVSYSFSGIASGGSFSKI